MKRFAHHTAFVYVMAVITVVGSERIFWYWADSPSELAGTPTAADNDDDPRDADYAERRERDAQDRDTHDDDRPSQRDGYISRRDAGAYKQPAPDADDG